MIKSIINECHKPITAYIGSKQVWQNYSPADLFLNGEQGVWFDPSDLSTMFQDVNGTEPVTKDGDPVGLILDKSQSLDLGEDVLLGESIKGFELKGAGVALSPEGIGSFNSDSSAGDYILARKITAKKVYEGSINVTSISSGAIWVRSVSGGYSSQAINQVGIHKFIFSSNNTALAVQPVVAGTVAEFKDLKVREIKGNHASQPSASARPIYRTDGDLHWLEFDGVDDYIASNDFGLVQPHTYAVASTITALMLSGSRVLVDGLTINSSSLGVRYVGARLYAGTGDYTPPSLEVGKRVFVAKFDGDNSILLNNGITGIVRQVGSTNPKGVTLGAVGDGRVPSDTSIYGFISISKVTTTAEDLAVNTYLATKSGVTL